MAWLTTPADTTLITDTSPSNRIVRGTNYVTEDVTIDWAAAGAAAGTVERYTRTRTITELSWVGMTQTRAEGYALAHKADTGVTESRAERAGEAGRYDALITTDTRSNWTKV